MKGTKNSVWEDRVELLLEDILDEAKEIRFLLEDILAEMKAETFVKKGKKGKMKEEVTEDEDEDFR